MTLIPLWRDGARPVGPGRAVSSSGVTFSCMGRKFLYDPDDMRLHVSESPGTELVRRLRMDERVARPQFPLGDSPVRTVVLIPTLACNLRCRYCFADADRPDHPDSGRLLETDDALAAVRTIPAEVDATVGFFGGEPLLAFGRVRRLVEAVLAVRGSGRTRFTLTTNGVLLDDEIVEFLERHGFSLIVSIDGPPALHDANRPDASGQGTYARVAAALERLGRRPGLAARVTLRGTYDGGNPALLERVTHLNGLARDHGFGNVSVEPADLAESCARSGTGADGGGGLAPVTASEALAEEYFAVARWYADEEARGGRPLFHHFAVRLRRLYERRAAASECGAGVGYVTVAPDGMLYACHRLGDSAVGRAREGFDRELQAGWRDNRYYQRQGCSGCWLRNVCGGGCRLASRHRFGDWRRPDPLGCWLTDVCVRAAAWILAERKKGG